MFVIRIFDLGFYCSWNVFLIKITDIFAVECCLLEELFKIFREDENTGVYPFNMMRVGMPIEVLRFQNECDGWRDIGEDGRFKMIKLQYSFITLNMNPGSSTAVQFFSRHTGAEQYKLIQFLVCKSSTLVFTAFICISSLMGNSPKATVWCWSEVLSNVSVTCLHNLQLSMMSSQYQPI